MCVWIEATLLAPGETHGPVFHGSFVHASRLHGRLALNQPYSRKRYAANDEGLACHSCHAKFVLAQFVVLPLLNWNCSYAPSQFHLYYNFRNEKLQCVILSILFVFPPLPAFAWSKRGHHIISLMALDLLNNEEQGCLYDLRVVTRSYSLSQLSLLKKHETMVSSHGTFQFADPLKTSAATA